MDKLYGACVKDAVKLAFLFLIFYVIGLDKTFGQKVDANDSLALVAFYNATNGDNWNKNDNWLTGPVVTWRGITVGNNGRITSIDFYKNNLTGTLPPEIGNLSELSLLQIRNNSITGSIPMEIGNLGALVSLNLQSNQLKGEIPSELGNCKNLFYLQLGSNQFTGNIPPEIGNLSFLVDLSLDGNLLTGPIPIEIGKLERLKELDLSSNQLSGNLPLELFQLNSLKWLSLYVNNFSGNISSEIMNLDSLKYFQIMVNNFTGSIPDEITELEKLKLFNISGNQFTDIPDMVNLEKWQSDEIYAGLKIGHNQLSFDDIIPNLDVKIPFTYDNQNAFGVPIDTVVEISGSLQLGLDVDASVNDNVYTWYKDGTLFTTTTKNYLELENISIDDVGVYTCQITNPQVPSLILNSSPFTILPKVTSASGFISIEGIVQKSNSESGRYYTGESGYNGIPNVPVFLLSINDQSILDTDLTDAGGGFSFKNVPKGEYSLNVRYEDASMVENQSISINYDSEQIGLSVILGEQNQFSISEVSRVLSISESMDYETLVAYPNPTQGKVLLKNLDSSWTGGNVYLLDQNGKVLVNKPIFNFDDIDLSAFKDGIYHLVLRKNDLQKTFLLLKE
jgi:hypothetical protein